MEKLAEILNAAKVEIAGILKNHGLEEKQVGDSVIFVKTDGSPVTPEEINTVVSAINQRFTPSVVELDEAEFKDEENHKLR